MAETTHEELYRIINRAIENYGMDRNLSLTDEINIFSQKHRYRVQTNPQIDIFETSLPEIKEVKEAVSFCEDLEYIKQELDIDKDENEYFIPEKMCHRLLQRLKTYAPYLSQSNKDIAQGLAKTLKRYLPEYQKEIILNEYNDAFNYIWQTNKNVQKNQRSTINKDYLGSLAVEFYKKFKKDNYLQNMEACPEKIELYEKIIKIINFLPQDRFKRITKFNIKRDLYKDIKEMAEKLGPSYAQKAQKAALEEKRYQDAVDNVINYLQGKRIPKKRVEKTAEYYRKKALEEWLYK